MQLVSIPALKDDQLPVDSVIPCNMKTDALPEELAPITVLERLGRQAGDRGLVWLLERFADDLEADSDE